MTDTDDAPLWAEVWGMWFSLGMLFRTWVHMLTASDIETAGDLSWPSDDRTLRSPVAEIRGTSTELAAAVITAITGVLFWVVLPMTPPQASLAPLEYAAGVWLTTQVIPLLGDPVALAIAQVRESDRNVTNAVFPSD